MRAEFEPPREALLAERAEIAAAVLAANEAFEKELKQLKLQARHALCSSSIPP